MEYSINVDTSSEPATSVNGTKLSLNSVNNTNYYWDGTSTYTPSFTYYYGTTIYMYQLICPRCQTSNWGQIDKPVDCKGKLRRKACGAVLKAVSKKVDYEVEI